jgi:hypothetical protein
MCLFSVLPVFFAGNKKIVVEGEMGKVLTDNTVENLLTGSKIPRVLVIFFVFW